MDQPVFVNKPAFSVVGLKYRGKNATKQEIPHLWDRFIPREGEIQHRAEPHLAYGVMGNYDATTGDFDYLAGFGVNSVQDLPSDMDHWDVPAQHYAVFNTTLAAIHQTFDHIYRTWLPQSGYEHANGPAFELYDETFEQAERPLFIYIPVRAKS
jgi:AraC family transcriptional regulator